MPFTNSAFLSAVVYVSCFAYSHLSFYLVVGLFFFWVSFASSFKRFGLALVCVLAKNANVLAKCVG